MNANSFLSPRMMVGAAIVGLVSAAGVFVYEQIYAEKRRSMLVKEVARLDNQVTSMRAELEALRELQKETQSRQSASKRAALERRTARRKARPLGDAAPPNDNIGDTVDGLEQSYASDSEYMTDYQSVLGTDGEMDSEEFYDVHTEDDDDTLRDSPIRNGLDEDLSDRTDSPKSSPRNRTKK